MRIPSIAGIIFTWVALGALAVAQPTFDTSAYRQFLSSTKDIDAAGLQARYPAGTFTRTIGGIPSIAYLDSIDGKLHLTDDEKILLRRHGFVVTERLPYT
jgi:hypothetical protein